MDISKLIRMMANANLSGKTKEVHVDALVPAFERYEISSKERVCACLAQFGHETGGFRWLAEIGNDRYFNRYEFRLDLGNTQIGDGLKFKGRGYIQLTGRANYSMAQQWFPDIPFLEQPELMQQPKTAALVSCKWWINKGLNELADNGDMIAITKKINGGLNGLLDRMNRYNAMMKLDERRVNRPT